MLLLPLALAGTTPSRWNTAWVPALMAVGGVFLVLLVFYEAKFARRPNLPPRYLQNVSINLACTIGLLDAFAFSVTHTYMYRWATVVHLFSAREATFLTFTAGCMQIVSGTVTGWIMLVTKRYKYILVCGLIIRLIGYGVIDSSATGFELDGRAICCSDHSEHRLERRANHRLGHRSDRGATQGACTSNGFGFVIRLSWQRDRISRF